MPRYMTGRYKNYKRMKLEDYLQKHYTKKTADAYYREIEAYLLYCPNADTAVHKDIVAHIGVLRNRYNNAKTLNRILCAIKCYYHFLAYTGKRTDNPSKSIRLRDKTSRDIQLQDLFTEKELEALLDRKERYGLLKARNSVLTGLLIYQGLLPTELETLTTSDINLTQGTVYVKAGAKTKSRELSLKSSQIMILHEYIQKARPQLLKNRSEDFLLVGIRGEQVTSEDITKHIRRSFKGLYAPRKVNCQTIRQSVITNLLKAGNDLRIVQVFAGHKSPGTTEKYKQTSTESLKTAIQQYHPMR